VRLTAVPVYDAALFTDEALTDTYHHDRAMRDAGRAVSHRRGGDPHRGERRYRRLR
jgi:hypothetical protein